MFNSFVASAGTNRRVTFAFYDKFPFLRNQISQPNDYT
jgi:hypothetical protein